MFRNILLAGLVLATTVTALEAAPPTKYRPWVKHRIEQNRIKNAPIVGDATDGVYQKGGDRVILVATEFRGAFTADAIKMAFLRASKKLSQNDQSLELRKRVTRRLASDRHVVTGWYNATREEWGYVGMRILPDKTTIEAIYNDGENVVIKKWKTTEWDTNGFTIVLKVSPDTSGNALIWFDGIK